MFTLFDDQKEVLTETSQALIAGYRSVLVQYPTGGGKTVIAGEIARRLSANTPEGRHAALFLCHRKELINQAYDTLCKFGLGKMTGVVASGYPVTPWAKFQIGSIPTLVRRFDSLSWLKPRLLFFDEAHHIRANSWEQVAEYFRDVARIGLTATPARLDGKGLGTHFDHLIIGPTIQELVAMKRLAPCRTFVIPPRFDRSQFRTVAGDFSKGDLAKIDDGPVIADVLLNFERLIPDRRTIVFNFSVAASQHTAERFRAVGYRAEHVDGETPDDVRDKIFRRFHRGETQILCNVMLATEGYDCPACDAVMVARPTKSIVLWKQMAGRGMRYKEERDMVFVDCAGNADFIGDPDAEVEWTLEDGITEASAQEAKATGRTCKSCGYRFRKGLECPLCGAVAPVRTAREVEIELEESKGSRAPKTTVGQRRRLRQAVIASGGDKERLRELARKMGYNEAVIYTWASIWSGEWEKQRVRAERKARQMDMGI